VRSLARLLLAAGFAALPIGIAMMSCGTDAVAVDACRQIETARCNAAPACSPGFDVDGCTLFYRDACLVGIGNADAGDVVAAQIQGCITALQACTPDAAAEAGCPGQALHAGATCGNGDGGVIADPTACDILMHCPEVLEACHFVAALPVTTSDAGDGGDASDASDASDAADTGDATGE
jgi:hypothetical protein